MESVLYLSYDGLTDVLGQSQIVPYLQGLSSKGYRIYVVSFEKTESFIINKNLIAVQLDKAEILWKPLVYHKTPPVFSTLYDLFQLWRTAKNLYQTHNFKIIHCRSYMTSIIGLAIKRRYKAKFLFDMRGFWADERVDGKIWNIENPVYKSIYIFFKKLEKSFFKNADVIISLTYTAKEDIKSRIGLKENHVPIEVIPCTADSSLFNRTNVPATDFLDYQNKLGIKFNDFVVVYLGSIGTWYMLDEMLDFFKVLKQKKANAKFLFITTEKHSVIRTIAETKSIPTDAILTYKAARKEVPILISLCDISIFFIKPSYSKKASSPTKQGELMAMGIPIICNSGIGDTDKIIRKYNAGRIIEEFNEETYSSVVDDIDEIVKLDKSSMVQGATEVFSLECGINSYARVYERLLK